MICHLFMQFTQNLQETPIHFILIVANFSTMIIHWTNAFLTAICGEI